jgi:hypothetical protein
MSDSIKREFFSWIDSVLSGPIPKSTSAFHFNLYEGIDSIHVQLIGTESFEHVSDYSPGGETFSTGENIFEVPLQYAGPQWPQWLEYMKQLALAYIESGARSPVLRNSLGVGIGFVDGDMYVLWPPLSA